MPQAQTFSSRQSEPTAQMTGEEKVWVAEGSLGLVRAVRATYFFARITAFFTGDAVGCQKTVMLFSHHRQSRGSSAASRPGPRRAVLHVEETGGEVHIRFGNVRRPERPAVADGLARQSMDVVAVAKRSRACRVRERVEDR